MFTKALLRRRLSLRMEKLYLSEADELPNRTVDEICKVFNNEQTKFSYFLP